MLGRRLGDERHGFALPPGLRCRTWRRPLPPTEGSQLGAGEVLRRAPLRVAHLEGHRGAALRHQAADRAQGRRARRRRGARGRRRRGGARRVEPRRASARRRAGDDRRAARRRSAAVAGRIEVLVDGGVRWGTDVLQGAGARARARCCSAGRSCGGSPSTARPGVRAVLETRCATSCRVRWRWRAVKICVKSAATSCAKTEPCYASAALPVLRCTSCRILVDLAASSTARCAGCGGRSRRTRRPRRSGTTTIPPIVVPSTTPSSVRTACAARPSTAGAAKSFA